MLQDVPQLRVNLPYALAAADRLHLHRDFRLRRPEYEVQQRSAMTVFDRLRKRHDFPNLASAGLSMRRGFLFGEQ